MSRYPLMPSSGRERREKSMGAVILIPGINYGEFEKRLASSDDLIRTPKGHAWVLKELERLWDAAGTDTPDGHAFETLAAWAEAYEEKHFPILSPDSTG